MSLKCPECKRLFLSGGSDNTGIYYYCKNCKIHFRKDLFERKQKSIMNFIGLQNDYVDGG